MHKCAVLLFVFLLTFPSLVIAEPTGSEIPKPSVPEFSLKLEHHIYDQPAVYGTDPYTGEKVVITPAQHQETTRIVITIQNQPFTPYKDSEGNLIEMGYTIRSKGHFTDIWSEGGVNQWPNSTYSIATQNADYYPTNAQIDFQVKAWIGYSKDMVKDQLVKLLPPYFVGERSDWSNIQTIKLSDGSVTTTKPAPSPTSTKPPNTPTPTPSPTPTPQQSDTWSDVLRGIGMPSAVFAMICAAGVIFVAILAYSCKKRGKTSPSPA